MYNILGGNIMVGKYIKLFIKRNILTALICSFLVFVPIFIVSLIFDVLSYDLFVAFIPFPIALVYVLISLLPIIRFKKMIIQQEVLYNVEFCDTDSINLETTLFLNKEWLICAGSCAIYKKHIHSVNYKKVTGRVGSSYNVTIHTNDNKHYSVWCLSLSSIKKIKDWIND